MLEYILNLQYATHTTTGTLANTHLVILIRSDGSELGSRKMEGFEIVPVEVVDVLRFHHV